MKSVCRCLSTVFLGAFGLWVVCLVPAAEAANGLLATHPNKFAPVTFESGRPKFHIPPGSRLARNEHPCFLLVNANTG